MANWFNRIYATAVYSILPAMAIAGCTSNPPAPVPAPPPPPQLQWVRMQNDVPAPENSSGYSVPVFTACAPGGVRLYAINPGYSSGGVAMAAIDTTNSHALGGECPKQG